MDRHTAEASKFLKYINYTKNYIIKKPTKIFTKDYYASFDKEDINKDIIEKELEIIKAETINSGKPADMSEKISKGKISKFLNDNSLLSQIWIMDPKKKVSDILKENSLNKTLQVLDFVRYKVGEGV